jgi:hypothetical protein
MRIATARSHTAPHKLPYLAAARPRKIAVWSFAVEVASTAATPVRTWMFLPRFHLTSKKTSQRPD